jgi:branched-chain amino acid transport system permease protein
VTLLLQRLVDGVQSGCIYASLALAIVLVFRGTGMLNFAQGELAMISTYVTWTLQSSGLPLALAILASMAVSFVLGALVERVVFRPIAARSAGEHLPLIAVSIGLLLGVHALAQWIWGPDGRVLPSLFGSGALQLSGVSISDATLGALGVLVAVAAALGALMNRTRAGLAMRAVATSREHSALVGIRVSRVLLAGWGLAGALGALAGALVAPTVTAFDNGLMSGVLVLALAAATIGGFDSLAGAVVGGLLVGILESLAGGYIANDLKLSVAFVVLLGMLLLKPTGFFGSRRVVRA